MWLLKKIKEAFASADVFELGISFAAYYTLIFFIITLIPIFRLPSKINKYDILALDYVTVGYIAVGLLAFLVGYAIVRRLVSFRPSFLCLNTEWDRKRFFKVFGTLFVLNILLKIIWILNGAFPHFHKNEAFIHSSLYSALGFLNWVGPIVLAMACVYYFYDARKYGKSNRLLRGVVWASFGIEFFYGFFSGSRYETIVPILIYLLTRHYLVRKSYARICLALLFIFLFLIPAMNMYRKPSYFFQSYVQEEKGVHAKGIAQEVTDSTVGRLSQYRLLSFLFRKPSPPLYGQTLVPLFTSLGPPRFIWKNKPTITPDGNKLGRDLGILGAGDKETSVGPTMVGDLFLNFSFPGIVVGMFFFGALFALIYNVFIRAGAQLLSGVVIYTILWIQIMKGLEDWIAPVYAGLIKLLVLLLIIHLALIWKPKLKHA